MHPDDLTDLPPAAPAPDPGVPASAAPVVVQPVRAAGASDDEWLGYPGDRSDARRTATRQNRVAGLATILVVVALAFGSGIAIGRATAPASGGTAALATTAPSGSDAAASGAAGASSGTAGASSGAAGASASPVASSFPAGLPSDGALLGSKNAKVQLTYWADFQCPYCAKFAKDVLPQLASRIADGTVSVLHRDYIFIGQESIDAAASVRCGGEQGQYWPMHDAVYAGQAGENKGGFAVDKLKAIAASVGLDATKFAACIDRHDVLVAALADTAAGARSGVTSTPTLDIPGQRFLGVPDTAAFLKAIDAAAATGAAATPAPSVSPSGDPWLGTPTDGRTAGKATAPVTVELWVDYQAANMPAMVQNLEPGLRTRVGAGKVQLVLRDLATLGQESVDAASFDRCATKAGGSGWFTSDVMGVSGSGANAGVFVSRNLLWFAARMGYDVAAIDTCMADPATAAAVTAETAVGTGLGLKEAPAVIVKVGDRETARFSGSLDVAKVLAAVDAAK